MKVNVRVNKEEDRRAPMKRYDRSSGSGRNKGAANFRGTGSVKILPVLGAAPKKSLIRFGPYSHHHLHALHSFVSCIGSSAESVTFATSLLVIRLFFLRSTSSSDFKSQGRAASPRGHTVFSITLSASFASASSSSPLINLIASRGP